MPDGRPPRAERRKGIKKTIACLLLVCALLGGCARSDGDVSVCAALARPFIMSAAYEIGEVSGTLVFEHRALGSGVLKFCEPQTLSGLTMTLADGYVTIERGEISRSYAAGDVAEGNLLVLLSGLCDAAAVAVQCGEGDSALPRQVRIDAVNGIPRSFTFSTCQSVLSVTGFEFSDGA